MALTEPLSCIIVDDEEGAHLVIGHHIEGLKSLKLCGHFYNAKEALDYIYQTPVDLIFLDINMPGLTGMEMLQAMTKPPLVVLTTAYSEYALESYKYQVVDYLIKPIALPQFLAAVNKVISRFSPIGLAALQPADAGQKTLTLKVDGNFIKIDLQHIDYIQSWGNYVKVFSGDKIHLSSITTTEIERKLDKSQFIRIHKSYIVGLDKIRKIKGNQVYLGLGVILPLGNTYRREVIEKVAGL